MCPSQGTRLRYKFWNTLPLELTAALATWVRTRRIIRLPWGLRLFLETSADSSRPGHTPPKTLTVAVRNEAADGPTCARICGAESMPQPGTSASRCTASWYAASAGGPFFGPGLDLTLDELNSGEKQAEDLTLQDAERGRFAEGIRQLLRGGSQGRIGQIRQLGRGALSGGQCGQHPPAAPTPQVAHPAR